MQTALEGAEQSAPATDQQAPAFEETVLSLLTDLTERMSRQDERLEALEKRNEPRWIDPRLDAVQQANDRSKRALSATPDGNTITVEIFYATD